MDREDFVEHFKDKYDLSEVAKNLETSESIHLFIRNGAVQKTVVGIDDTSLKAAFRQYELFPSGFCNDHNKFSMSIWISISHFVRLLPPNPAEEDA